MRAPRQVLTYPDRCTRSRLHLSQEQVGRRDRISSVEIRTLLVEAQRAIAMSVLGFPLLQRFAYSPPSLGTLDPVCNLRPQENVAPIKKKCVLFLLLVVPSFLFAQRIPKLSGTVIDTSGAVIAGATIQVRSPSGTVQTTTQTDANGSFIISGLSAGNYRLVVSNAGFETKEIPITIETTEAQAPLRIALAVSSVSTTVNVQSRADSLIGIAESATQGTVGAAEIQDRPILRSGEVLETIPGVIITQHAGGGKANQYFLRGFNLDHGTDFAIFLDGMPLNLPSHAHGEGYADMNTVIPEFVERVDYDKGPYAADVGNYGSAGSAHLVFFKALPQNFFKVEGGMYGYGRAVFGVSHKLGSGNLLFGGEVSHDDGPWKHPDDYYKFNGFLTYSRGGDANGFSVTARGYHGKWDSSDQIAENAVPLVGFFGSLNPTDGGNSERYSLQAEWHRQNAYSETKIMAYGFYYDLDLFSDFTYFLTDSVRGD